MKLKRRFILSLKTLGNYFRFNRTPVSFIHEQVAYFSQWESRELAGEFLKKTKQVEDDPKWQQSGAKTRQEYSDWSWAGCGMACLKMILAHSQEKVVPLVALGKQCAEYGGYRYPLDKSPGLFYKPFVRFVSQEYDLSARALSTLTLHEIIDALAQQGYVMASVNPSIRDQDSTPPNKTGHLILIIGYDLAKKVLYFHNPSGIDKASQEYIEISFDNFKKFFGNQGIILNTG